MIVYPVRRMVARNALYIKVFWQEAHMLILEPNGHIDRRPQQRAAWLRMFWEKLARWLGQR